MPGTQCLRGRRLKGKGKGVLGARETRRAREEGGRTCVCITESLPCVPDIIVLGLGTGRYLSPVGGGAQEDFRGGSLDFREKKRGESVVTSNPKGGITEKFGRIQRGDYSNLIGK